MPSFWIFFSTNNYRSLTDLGSLLFLAPSPASVVLQRTSGLSSFSSLNCPKTEPISFLCSSMSSISRILAESS